MNAIAVDTEKTRRPEPGAPAAETQVHARQGGQGEEEATPGQKASNPLPLNSLQIRINSE